MVNILTGEFGRQLEEKEALVSQLTRGLWFLSSPEANKLSLSKLRS